MVRRRFLASVVAFGFPLSLLATSVFAAKVARAPAPVFALLIGGGPTPDYNQVAIESNVRYVDSLLPAKTPRTILFADGKRDTNIVQYQVETQARDGEAMGFATLLFPPRGRNAGGDEPALKYRPTNLRQIDGPSVRERIGDAFASLKPETGGALLYFTGHGSPGQRDFDTNRYDLWRSPGLTAADLSKEIEKLPSGAPVTLIMVQCYSGGFANVLFKDANPEGELVDRPIVGYFAATRERTAAGCTPEVNEAEYRDFTGYFFAALTGKDRVGRTVAAPDYNRDGRVGMDEAYAYSLIFDQSIDVPVATSDAFLRRFVPVKDDAEITGIPFETMRKSASPAQRAALDGLCEKLGPRAQTPDRIATALAEFRKRSQAGDGGDVNIPAETSRRVNELRDKYKQRFPDLDARGERAAAARKELAAWLSENPAELSQLKSLGEAIDRSQRAALEDEVTGARWLRLVRLAKSIVLEQRLRETGDKAIVARFDALKKLEAGNPLR